MANTLHNTNAVTINGIAHSDPILSHEVLGEKFYLFELETKRKSDTSDYIPVMVPERLIYIDDITEGTKIAVRGSFRSYDKHIGDKSKLLLSVFAEELLIQDEIENINEIILEGFICREPKYRKTRLGREIADLLLAVNRAYGKTDYIPCITWGRNAAYSERLKVGTKIYCRGRIHSRIYYKDKQERVAYEVSINEFQLEE